jgi:hypothetical protein
MNERKFPEARCSGDKVLGIPSEINPTRLNARFPSALKGGF